MSKTLKPTKVIKRREYIEVGDEAYAFPLFAHIRMSRYDSAQLMKYQGLCYKYGNKETLRFLFSKVCLPAISAYCRRYAQKAANSRQERSAKKGV